MHGVEGRVGCEDAARDPQMQVGDNLRLTIVFMSLVGGYGKTRYLPRVTGVNQSNPVTLPRRCIQTIRQATYPAPVPACS